MLPISYYYIEIYNKSGFLLSPKVKDIFIKLCHALNNAMNSKIYEYLADLEQKFLTAELTKRQFVFMSFKAIKNNTLGASYLN